MHHKSEPRWKLQTKGESIIYKVVRTGQERERERARRRDRAFNPGAESVK